MQQVNLNQLVNSMMGIMVMGMMGTNIMLQIAGQKDPADMLYEGLRDELQAVTDYGAWYRRALDLGDTKTAKLFEKLKEDESRHVLLIRNRVTEIGLEKGPWRKTGKEE